jgi:predicted ATP-binding protein involved in virulence
MKIKDLELKNFHGFDSRVITFNEHFTVLVGDNGSGKTAILEGLNIALGAFLSGFKGIKSRYIRKEEIYKKHKLRGKKVDIQEQYPVMVKAYGRVNEEDIFWSREINDQGGTTTSRNSKSIMKHASNYQQSVRDFKDVILPIVSYYSTQRLWGQKNNRTAKLKHNRLEGYENVLDPMSDLKNIFKWIEDMRYIELQEEEPIDILVAVNNAITECVEDCQSVRYDVKHKKLMIFKTNEEEPIPFDLLSDGYRSVIGLIADLATRMAMLNPFLGENVCKITPGVVLIDELDLHLHPRWQRKIVGDLKKVFPKVQFITTTHSPFIIQSLNPGELRRLKKIDDDEEVANDEFINRSIEEISEIVMEMGDVKKSKKLLEKSEVAREYFQLLLEGKNPDSEIVKKTKQRLDYLESLYSDDVAYYTFLRVKREVLGWGD